VTVHTIVTNTLPKPAFLLLLLLLLLLPLLLLLCLSSGLDVC
jgi:hypothetical protein